MEGYKRLTDPENALSPWPAWRVVRKDGMIFAVGHYRFASDLMAVAFREGLKLWESIWLHDLHTVTIKDGTLHMSTVTHDEDNTLTDRDFLLINSIDNMYALVPQHSKG